MTFSKKEKRVKQLIVSCEDMSAEAKTSSGVGKYSKVVEEEKRMPKPGEFPTETQRRPEGVGLQYEMQAQPVTGELESESKKCTENITELVEYKPSQRLLGRKALITGGDSGIGRSVALFFAMEGADVVISYLPVEEKDAEETRDLILREARRVEGKESDTICELVSMDLQTEKNCQELINRTVKRLGGLDLLVNNAAYQMTCDSIEQLSSEQVEKTFRTNVFAPIFLVKYALPHMSCGSSIIFSTSVVAYRGITFWEVLVFSFFL
eukprot:TRINITY_DN2040_c0_g1_i4.p1 TRINITY_DN2040_c0_g1~~TRINITY_DN2040_c0_g1_i4.p1  ORF type:complete len:266 (+),score=51.73 TRINITY_DN2040_c0_g1_i4:295-1092(+)